MRVQNSFRRQGASRNIMDLHAQNRARQVRADACRGLRVSVFDPDTHGFSADSTYRSLVLYDCDNLARVMDERAFE
jgi:hypothetical protein